MARRAASFAVLLSATAAGLAGGPAVASAPPPMVVAQQGGLPIPGTLPGAGPANAPLPVEPMPTPAPIVIPPGPAPVVVPPLKPVPRDLDAAPKPLPPAATATKPIPKPVETPASEPPKPDTAPPPAEPPASPEAAPAAEATTPLPEEKPATPPPGAPPAAPPAADAPTAAPTEPPPPATAAPAEQPPAPGQAGEAPRAAMPPPEEVDLPQRAVVFVTGRTTWDEAEEKMSDAFGLLAGALDKAKVRPSGPPLVQYIETDAEDVGYKAMLPVEVALKGKLPKGVKIGEAPSGKAWRFRHDGSLDDLEEVYGRIDDWLAETKHDLRMVVEEYDEDALASPEDRVVVVVWVFVR